MSRQLRRTRELEAQGIPRAEAILTAADETERALLWKGRKSAFGAIAQSAPDYYLHDTVVPRTKLVEALNSVYEISERYDACKRARDAISRAPTWRSSNRCLADSSTTSPSW